VIAKAIMKDRRLLVFAVTAKLNAAQFSASTNHTAIHAMPASL
jgi:hypothetical protein